MRAKPVTDAADGFNEASGAGQLFAKISNVDVDGARVAGEVIAPNDAEQVIAGKDTTGILHEERQDFKLGQRDVNGSAVKRGRMLFRANDQAFAMDFG